MSGTMNKIENDEDDLIDVIGSHNIALLQERMKKLMKLAAACYQRDQVNQVLLVLVQTQKIN